MARDENPPLNKRIPDVAELEAAALAGPDGIAIDDGNLEAQSLNRGLPVRDIKKEAEEADHERNETFKNHFERMALVVVWLLFLTFILFGGVWVWHTVLPARGWLEPLQLQAIQGLLTGGIIAGLIADHIRRRMG